MRQSMLTTCTLATLAAVACAPVPKYDVLADTICVDRRELISVDLIQAASPTVPDGSASLVVRFPGEVAPLHPHGGAEAALLRNANDENPTHGSFTDSTQVAEILRVPPGQRLLRLRAVGFARLVAPVTARAGFADTVLVRARITPCRPEAG